jgi:hypothetical protein
VLVAYDFGTTARVGRSIRPVSPARVLIAWTGVDDVEVARAPVSDNSATGSPRKTERTPEAERRAIAAAVRSRANFTGAR